jgi:hypothetical protein
MPSPFPGMDPYLESWIWPDLHLSVLVALSERLNKLLSKRWVASIGDYRWAKETRRPQRFIWVHEPRKETAICTIEFMSPELKAEEPGREAYLSHRSQRLLQGINLVEIDLIRASERLPPMPPSLSPADYCVTTTWAEDCIEIYRGFSVRDPMPTLSVLLTPDDPIVVLDLRAALDRAYECGRYAEQLDYTKPPTPPLREPDATWARELLAARSNR